MKKNDMVKFSIFLTIISIIYVSCHSKSHKGKTKDLIMNVIDAYQQTKEKQENKRIKRMVDRALSKDFNKICYTKQICEKIAFYPKRFPLSKIASFRLGFLQEIEERIHLKNISLLFDKLEKNNEMSVFYENKRIKKLMKNKIINKQKIIEIEVAKYNKLLDICESVVLSKINCK